MNRAIMWKTWRDTQLLFWLVVVVIFVFEHIFVFAMRTSAEHFADMAKRFPFMVNIIQTLVGAKLEVDATVTSFIAIGFSHPFLFAVMWAFIVTNCTRVIVAEIERGTADLLMSLPVSRLGLYTSVTAVWALVGIPACVMPWVGIWFAVRAFPVSEPLNFARLWLPIVNLYALYLAIGCATMWVSTLHARRGPAIAWVIGLLLASFLINFLVAMVPSLNWLGYLGVLQYYRPLESVRSGDLPTMNLVVLGVGALVAWFAGLGVFMRRDIPAA
ncbi:MAG: ABC transporter permease subunit [Phycisphaerae bacterium]